MTECTCLWVQMEIGGEIHHAAVDDDCPGHGADADHMEACS